MINDKYYNGYEGETEVLFYYNQNDQKNGLRIWNGYFENLLIGCYDKIIRDDGILICYQSQIGFYDESEWKIRSIETVISELKRYKENNNQSKNLDILLETRALRNDLIELLQQAKLHNKDAYIVYD